MKIGPHDIHPGVIWENEISAPAVAQQISETILGSIKNYFAPVTKKEMIFAARDAGKTARGIFTREQVDYLRAAEKSQNTIVVEYRNILYSVIVKAGGVNLISKRETEEVSTDDPHTGTVAVQEI